MAYTPPAGYPYENDSAPGAADGDIVYAEIPNHIMAYLQDELPIDIAAAAGSSLDHGTQLTGLADDDHTQYALADGSRGTFEVAGAVAAHTIATDPHGDRAYADALFAAFSVTSYQGLIDCSGNPNYPAADEGEAYRVSVAGKIGGASGPNVEVGDYLICNANGTASGNHATVGSSWTIVQANLNGVVVGPAGAIDGRVAVFDGSSGYVINQASVTISDLTDYTPAVSADWPGADPTTQIGALDKLAERVTDTETDIAAINPDRVVQVAVTDPNGAALTTGDNKAYALIPALMNGQNLTAVQAGVTTQSSSGAVTVQVARVRAGTPVDMLSTALTIDANESTSATAATAAVINTSNDDIATSDFIRIDIDGAGTGAKGLIVTLTFATP